MEHIPVLLDECISGLALKPEGIYVDGTLGRGGHSAQIAKRLETGLLIGIDRDRTAIEEAEKRLSDFEDRVKLVQGNFRDIDGILDSMDIQTVDGMLFDLGVSSPQLDDSERGFSYTRDAPIDMRMDAESPLTASDIVNTWAEEELRRILFEYGEERYSRRIASAIVRVRGEKRINTTLELAEIIRSAMPAAALREKQHPAKRSFQGIRIAVNDELGSLAEMLDKATDRLKTGGRICVISFHSLEDRIVKNAFASKEKGCTCPRDFPVCVCGFVPTLKVISRKPVTPESGELEVNPRARSAKLRIAEKV